MGLKRNLAALLVLTVLAGWLRVWNIGAQSLWFDEVFSRNVAVDSDIGSILRNGVAGDVHPPLYFILLNGWVRLTGDSEIGLRMLSVLLALLSLPAFYHLARLMFGERAGLIALGLAVLSPFQTYYAQEARQYALSITCAAWASVGLIRLLRGKKYGAAIYVIGALAGLYTHYFTGLLLIAVHLWLVVDPEARRLWRSERRRWLIADATIAILFLPQLIVFVSQASAVFSGFWIDRPYVAAPLSTLTFLLFSTTLPPLLIALAEVLTIGALAVLAWDMLRVAPGRIRSYWSLCLIALLGTLLPALIVSMGRSSIYLDRSFGLLSPFLIAALAGGIAYARRASPAPILVAALAVLMIGGTVNHALTPDAAKPPYRAVAADLLAHPDAFTVPVLDLHDSAYLPLSYYAPALDQRLVDIGEQSWLFPKTWTIFGVGRIARAALGDWLATYRGKLRVVQPAKIEPMELATLAHIRDVSCTASAKTYNQQVIVYEFVLGPCVTRATP